MKRNKPINFPYNSEKATQAVLWFLQAGKGLMDKLQLVKLFFYADREHLARYGRPIIGGTYYAMPNGPVCSELLDDINKSSDGSSTFILKGHELTANGMPDKDWLSESDLDILDEIYRQYGHIDRFKLRDMTHELKAYKKHWPPKNGARELIPYEDIFEDLDDDRAKSMLEIIYDEQDAWADFV